MRVTPPHLQKALSCVKRFVERQPSGATLTQLQHKVSAYHQLKIPEKKQLIEIIRETGILCVVEDGRLTTLHHPKFGHESIKQAGRKTPAENSMNTTNRVTPEILRKQAEELIRAAEEAEKKSASREEVRKQLDPIKLEVLQGYGMASRKFDEFIDAMAELGKSVQKLKSLTL
ncbi:TPA: hypothetical protein R5S02_004106 [Salmonella enterica]|nr:hypothetical protein [Salmonella enterica]